MVQKQICSDHLAFTHSRLLLLGPEPLGHHLTNNILHAVNTLIVVLLVTQLLEFSRKGQQKDGSSPGFLTDRFILITGAAAGLLLGLHPLHLGYAYYFKGQPDTAIEEYERSLRLKLDIAFVHLDLANAYYTKGQFNRAIEHYLASIRLDPNSPNAYYNLGNAYMSRDRFDPVIEAFQAAVSLKPDFVDAYYNLGLVYQKKGMLAGARSAFERVLSLKPDDNEARNMLRSIARD